MTVVSIMRSAISRASSRELIAAIPRFSRVVAGFALALTLLASAGARAQTAAPLTLEATIRLDNIGGRIDHMAFDRGRQHLLVAALGNNTLEVIDARAGKRVGEITGLDEPQGVAWSEKAQIIFVANAGDGSVRMFQAGDLAPAGRIDLHRDADNIRIDARNGNVVVAYGSGGLAVIDPVRRAVVGTVSLPGHPEGFQIDPTNGKAYVNIPDADQIAVVDLDARRQVGTWKVPQLKGNFPMALDAEGGIVASVFRDPSRLVLLERTTGRVVANLPTCRDADDVFLDARRQRVYVSCGSGEIAVFQRQGENLNPLPSVNTSLGARTSLFLPESDRLFLAERATVLRSNAAIAVYRPEPGP
jgi:DNA-binding beta-propeller fold protein YncE